MRYFLRTLLLTALIVVLGARVPYAIQVGGHLSQFQENNPAKPFTSLNSDYNQIFAALATHSAGSSAPTIAGTGQTWYNESTGQFEYVPNGGNGFTLFSALAIAGLPVVTTGIINNYCMLYNSGSNSLVFGACPTTTSTGGIVQSSAGALLGDLSAVAGGTGKLQGFSVNAVLNVKSPAYLASGSAAVCASVSVNSGATSFTCSGNDYVTGQGVHIPGAGPASPLTAVNSITLTPLGTTGGTSLTYDVCTADPKRGISGCATATTTTANAVQSTANPVEVAFTKGSVNAQLYLIYKEIGATWYFITEVNGGPFYDIGYVAPTTEGWPATPASQTQDYWGTVTSVSGSTVNITPATTTTVSSITIKHDDSIALQAAISACSNGSVYLPAGTYNVNLPQNYNATYGFQYDFVSGTNGYPSLFYQGMLNVGGPCEIYGPANGPAATIVTEFMGNRSGSENLFGFNVGLHENPLVLSPGPTAYAINNSSIGSSQVVTTTAGDAANFSPGGYVLTYGGASVAGSYISNELNVVISANSSTGVIQLKYPLEKPLPYGTVGTNPAIINLNGQVVTDVNIHDLIIKSYGGVAVNTSGTFHTHFDHITAPYWGVSDWWDGGFRRDWTIDNSNVVSSSQEIDLDEDVAVRNTTWATYSSGIVADEATSTVTFDKDILNWTELLCASGNTCAANGSAGSTWGAQGNAWNVKLTNSIVNANCNSSNALETGGTALVLQGGVLSGFPAQNFAISDNAISSNNCADVFLNNAPMIGLTVDHNVITHTVPAATHIFGVALNGGTVDNNTYTLNQPSGGGSDAYAFVRAEPLASYELPISITNNYITMTNGPTHTCINIVDPGSISYALPIYVHGNNCPGAYTGFTVGSIADTPLVMLDSNVCPGCTAPFSPTSLGYSNRCDHGQTPPTTAAGSIATGGTDCSFENTGATTSSTTVTFGTTWQIKPHCTCNDETTAAGLKVVDSTSTTVVSGLTANDNFKCACQGGL